MTENKHEAGPSPPLQNDPSTASVTTAENVTTTSSESVWRRIYNVLSWTPPRCRWDPEKPPVFSMGMNVLFGFAGCFTVANLYYNHPILNIIADDFNVPYEEAAQIPTLMQAGYAAGLLFLCPLGDIFKRRAFTLLLVLFTATLWIGLCLTRSLAVFSAISFLTAVTTVTPQLMLPLVGDLAPPHRRAAALSIVSSGILLGLLIARLLSGILTNFTSWRTIYWVALGLQYFIFILLWLFMPDYPSTNPGGLNYFKMLWSILTLCKDSPVLVQSCIVSFLTSQTFTNFWTTLTFLLSSAPYTYSSLEIGLFALIGIAAMFTCPLWAKHVIDRFVPLFSVVLGELWCLLGICIGAYTGTFTVAGPIIQAFFNDFGLQTAQIANRSAIYSIAPKARNRVNTAFMVATFCGQLVGTAAGNHLYARGGWVLSGSYSVACVGVALLFCVVKGPWEEGWFGWTGGWSVLKRDRASADGKGDGVVKDDIKKNPDVEQAVVNQTDPEKALEMDSAEDGTNVVREINERDEEEKSEDSRKTQDQIGLHPAGPTVAGPQ